MCYLKLLVLIVVFISISSMVMGKYEPNWKSLDSRPLPKWYDESKIGIFMHWGVYSVPSFGAYKQAAEWFWKYWSPSTSNIGKHESPHNKEEARFWNYVRQIGVNPFKQFMAKNYRPDFTYGDFANQFRAELFNENAIADLISKSGAKYFVLTAKHHEGFCNWDTKYSFNWNSQSVGPKTDLVGRLAAAIRKRTNVTFGLYHSMYEWFNPLYEADKANKFKTNTFVTTKVMPALKELITKYKPAVVWSDGDWEAPSEYWQSLDFLTWLYNESPVKNEIVVNDRWGSGCVCHHGGYLTCSDRYIPNHLPSRKWEMCNTLDRYSWGYRREMILSDVLSIKELITKMVSTVSLGGNFLLNVGPRSDGTISPIFEERLLQMGTWLRLNSEAIYSSHPFKFQNDPMASSVWYTTDPTKTKVYAICTDCNLSGKYDLIALGRFNGTYKNKILDAEVLGMGKVKFSVRQNYTMFYVPNIDANKNAETLRWAFTIKIVLKH